MKKKIIGIIIIYVVFLISCVIFGPLVQKKQGSDHAQNQQLSGGGETAGERVLCIDDNQDALLWRLRLIENAEREIILTTFNFSNDQSGTDIMAALLHAADRGVHIRILADGFLGTFNQRSASFDVLVAHDNIETKLYNPINLLTAWDANYRLHDKFLMVDDRIYLLGGRNTTDLSLGAYSDSVSTDRDVLVYRAGLDEDASVFQLKRYFEQLWTLSCNITLTCGSPKEAAAAQLNLRYTELRRIYPECFSEPDWIGETLPVNSVSLICNPIANTNKEPELWNALCALMAEGENVIIQTPYIMCNQEMYQGLLQITRSGTNVTVITNAVANGANPWGCTDYLNQKDNILKTGVSVCEYYGDYSLHTKTVLIDDNLCVIGSFNLDMRSTYLDTETMLVIDCPELNRQLRDGACEQMEASIRISPDGTQRPGTSCQVTKLSNLKSALYTVLRVLILPIRHLL